MTADHMRPLGEATLAHHDSELGRRLQLGYIEVEVCPWRLAGGVCL